MAKRINAKRQLPPCTSHARAWLTKALSLQLLICGTIPALAQAQSQPSYQDDDLEDVKDSVNQGPHRWTS